MLKRLETDRSLARFAGQFVPLKIVTSNNPDWAKWSRKYPVDGNGIPRLYVVRADGEKLFGAVGSLPGDKLPQMMTAALQMSGRQFNEVEATALKSAGEKAKSELSNNNPLAAAHALASISSLGAPDELGSFARTAVLAGEAFEELQKQLESQVDDAQSKLSASGDQETLTALVKIAEAENAYSLFPKLRKSAGGLTREIKKEKPLADLYTQASGLVKARALVYSPKRNVKLRASSAFASLIRRYPGTEVETLARKDLEEIDPDAAILSADTPSMTVSPNASKPTTFRTWTSKSGTFETEAMYLQQKSGKVQLQLRNGRKIVASIDQLSESDQAYLRTRIQ